MKDLFVGILCSFLGICIFGILINIIANKKANVDSKIVKEELLQIIKYWLFVVLCVIFILIISKKI